MWYTALVTHPAHETTTYIVWYGTTMLIPFKTFLAFFPLPYCLYTPLTLTAKSVAIMLIQQQLLLGDYRWLHFNVQQYLRRC